MNKPKAYEESASELPKTLYEEYEEVRKQYNKAALKETAKGTALVLLGIGTGLYLQQNPMGTELLFRLAVYACCSVTMSVGLKIANAQRIKPLPALTNQ